MPNDSVDKDSWESSACYPRRTFYPLSDGPSIRNHRITMADFRPCSTCMSYSQANLYHYALQLISNQLEFTFARLRYFLGGDRPSQTTNHILSCFFFKKLSINFFSKNYQLAIKIVKSGVSSFASTLTSINVSLAPTYATHQNFPSNIKM